MDKKIEIIYLTNDSIIKSLCAKYWDTNGISLKYNTQSLIKEYKKYYSKLDGSQLHQIVTANAIAYFEGTELCNKCKFPYQRLSHRYPLWENRNGKELDEKKYCDKCYEELSTEQEQARQQEQEKLRLQKEKLMKDAFANKVYEQLNPSEYKFLYHCLHNYNTVCDKLKISKQDANLIVQKLDALHLINPNVAITNSILPELLAIVNDIVAKEKIEQMKIAIEKAVPSLKILEKNFLVSFSEAIKKYDDYEKRIVEAKTRWGLDLNDAENIYKRLVSLNLVNDEIENCPIILPEFAEYIKNQFTQKTKSIWENTPIEKDIYKLLIKKVKNLYVFPQVPYSAFTEKKDIEHLFVEFKNLIINPANYYLQCRVDFLLCNKQGEPKVVVEYQGGGHQEEKKKIKDEFKSRILQESGIQLKLVDKYNKDEVLENIRLLTKPKTLSQKEIEREVKENSYPKKIGYYDNETISLYRNTNDGFFVEHKSGVYSLPFKKEREITNEKVVEIIVRERKNKWMKEDEKKRTIKEFEKSGVKIMWNDNSKTYITNGTRIVPVPYYRHHKSMTEEECLELLNVPEEELKEFIELKRVIREFKEKNIQIIWYFDKPTIIDYETKVSVPKDTNLNDLTVDQCVDLLNAKRQKKKESE